MEEDNKLDAIDNRVKRTWFSIKNDFILPNDILVTVFLFISEPENQLAVLLTCKLFWNIMKEMMDYHGHIRGEYNFTPLIKSIFFAQITAIKYLLHDRKVDPSLDNDVVLRAAIFSENIQALKLLLADDRVVIGNVPEYTLMGPIKHGEVEFVRLILDDKRFKKTPQIGTPLCDILENGHVEMAKLLISKRLANVNQEYRNNDSDYPLRFACKNENIEFLSFLISTGELRPQQSTYFEILRNSWTKKNQVMMDMLLSLDSMRIKHKKTALILFGFWSKRMDLVDLEFLKTIGIGRRKIVFNNACTYGILPLFTLLVDDERVDPSDDNNIALKLACRSSNVDIASRLLGNPRIHITECEKYYLLWENADNKSIFDMLCKRPEFKTEKQKYERTIRSFRSKTYE